MSWPLIAIKDFCRTSSGGTPSRDVSEYYDGTIPWIKSGDLREKTVEHATEFITELAIQKSSAKIVPAGAILLAMYGATVGRMAMLGIDAATNQAVCSIIPDKKKAFTKYVYYALLAKVPEFLRNAVGGAQPNISQGMIKDTKVPLPPLTEQKRIAAVLDKADAIRRKRQQTIQLADEFLRAVFLDIFGDPVTNPKGWAIADLKDIAVIQIGPFGTQLHKEDYTSGGIPLINPTHIVESKIIPNPDLTIGPAKYDELPEYRLERDDIIMGRRGEMGRAAIVTSKEAGWLCGTGSLFIRPDKKGAFSYYLHKFLTSEYVKKHLETESLGATMPNLNKTIVGNIKVPIPDEISTARFQKALVAAEKLHARMNNGDMNMFASISQKAFRGGL